MSRIQHERVRIESEKLDLQNFQPMMTSETVRESKKRESDAEDWYEEPSRYLRKRERKESDYGSLSSLGSDMLKLDIMEQEPPNEEPDRSSKLLSECLTFRKTMTQLRKQTLTLVKVTLLNCLERCSNDLCNHRKWRRQRSELTRVMQTHKI